MPVSKMPSPSSAIAPSTSSASSTGNDFVVISKPKPRCVALIMGDPKTGKTTFCTDHCPSPVATINLDGRDEHAVYKANQSGKTILRCAVEYNSDDVAKLDHTRAKQFGMAALEKVIRNLKWAVGESRKGAIRTICLDTGTECDNIIRLAVRGTLENVQGDFGRSKSIMNEQWARLFHIARSGNAHFIVLARTQEIWVGNSPTGRFGCRGNDQMEILSDWSGMIRVKRKRKDPPKFELEIVRSGVNIGEMGNVYSEDDWAELGGPFAYACLNQYPDSDLEDWQ